VLFFKKIRTLKIMKIPKFPTRSDASHKGENGRVVIFGGSENFHGAPILAAQGALAAGVDLAEICCPQQVAVAARSTSLSLIVHAGTHAHLTRQEAKKWEPLLARADAVVIGNGFGTHSSTLRAVLHVLKNFEGPTVIDADALHPEILQHLHPLSVLTPHAGEFRRLFGCDPTPATALDAASRWRCVIVCTGPVDLIATPDSFLENHTGCGEMAVGGTGDALAGLIGGFLARRLPPLDAALLACHSWGTAGEKLSKKLRTFSAHDLLNFYQHR